MQTYSDPTRASDPHALPDVEVWYVDEFEAEQNALLNGNGTNDYLDCIVPDVAGWYYWHCFPGCLPDSDPVGPFDSAEAAERAAQEDASC